MKEWQFNVLFIVGVGGAIFLVLAPLLGLDITQNPTALAGLGAILTYVLTQRFPGTKQKDHPPKEEDDESSN